MDLIFVESKVVQLNDLVYNKAGLLRTPMLGAVDVIQELFENNPLNSHWMIVLEFFSKIEMTS